MRRRFGPRAGLLTLGCLCWAARPLAAAVIGENDFRIDLGGGYSDNVTRVHADQQADAIGMAALNFAYFKETRRLSLDAVGDLAYLYYSKHTFPSQLVGGFDGTGLFKIIEDRFDWVLSDNFGQSRRDPFQVDTAANLENINYLTTGPNITFRLGARLTAQIALRYSRVDYQKSPLDNNRSEGSLAIIRQLTSVSSLSLNIGDENVSFQDSSAAPGPDPGASQEQPAYHRQAAYIRLTSSQARTFLQADVGADRLSVGDDSFSGSLLRLNAVHRLTEMQSILIDLDREYSDSGDIFRTLQNAGGVTLTTQNVANAADPFLRQQVGLRWQLNGPRTLIDISGSYGKESYKRQSILNRTETSFSAMARRTLSPRLSIQGSITIDREDYTRADNQYFRDIDFSISSDLHLGPRSGLTFRFDRLNRVNNVPNNGTGENIVWISYFYGSARTRHQVNSPGMELIAWH